MFLNEIKLQIFIGDEEIMSLTIGLSRGHGKYTAGKRPPNGGLNGAEREWYFNNNVANAFKKEILTYQGVKVVEVADPTGNTDTNLVARTNKANANKCGLYVACHHNANTGRWSSAWGGTEVHVRPNAPQSRALANIVAPRIASAMKLKNRGVKVTNLHETREPNQMAILIEGGFMDSNIDIVQMRQVSRLQAQGKAIAEGVAQYFKLKKKSGATTKPKAPAKKPAAKKPANNNSGWNYNKQTGAQWKKQTGVWINGNQRILKRRGAPKMSAPNSGWMKAGQRLDYREIARADGHIWLLDLKSNQWVPVKTWNSRTGKVSKDWGTWK